MLLARTRGMPHIAERSALKPTAVNAVTSRPDPRSRYITDEQLTIRKLHARPSRLSERSRTILDVDQIRFPGHFGSHSPANEHIPHVPVREDAGSSKLTPPGGCCCARYDVHELGTPRRPFRTRQNQGHEEEPEETRTGERTHACN